MIITRSNYTSLMILQCPIGCFYGRPFDISYQEKQQGQLITLIMNAFQVSTYKFKSPVIVRAYSLSLL